MKKNPDPVDIHVGIRVKKQRILIGMSQAKLGKALDITFQQIQKYERGTNRIGASRLYKMSLVLGVSVSFFFEEYSKNPTEKSPPFIPHQKKSLKFMEDWAELSLEKKNAIHDLVKQMK